MNEPKFDIELLRALVPEKAPTFVLALDQGTTCTGWALVRAPDGKVFDSGTASGALTKRGVRERREVIQRVLAHVRAHDARLEVVFEDHTKMPLNRGTKRGDHAGTRETATLIGMGKARGRWEEHLAVVGGLDPKVIDHDVPPSEYRPRVLGLRNAGTALAKATAKTWASAWAKKTIESEDEAESVVIGVFWATRSVG